MLSHCAAAALACLYANSMAQHVLLLYQVEYLNPGGTSKDRIAASMIKEAEASGELKNGGTVVEGTSGSTGICLASLCRAKGYRCVIVMPDDQVRCIDIQSSEQVGCKSR